MGRVHGGGMHTTQLCNGRTANDATKNMCSSTFHLCPAVPAGLEAVGSLRSLQVLNLQECWQITERGMLHLTGGPPGLGRGWAGSMCAAQTHASSISSWRALACVPVHLVRHSTVLPSVHSPCPAHPLPCPRPAPLPCCRPHSTAGPQPAGLPQPGECLGGGPAGPGRDGRPHLPYAAQLRPAGGRRAGQPDRHAGECNSVALWA